MALAIKLINGPFNGVEIEDSGAAAYHIGMGSKPGDRCGFAIYEPNKERTHAFWLDNKWEGTIDQILPS